MIDVERSELQGKDMIVVVVVTAAVIKKTECGGVAHCNYNL